MVEMGSSGDADDEPNTRVCGTCQLTSDKSNLAAAIFFNRDGRLGNLDGSKNGFGHGNNKGEREKERKKERKEKRERRGFKIYCRLKEDIYFYLERERSFSMGER